VSKRISIQSRELLERDYEAVDAVRRKLDREDSAFAEARFEVARMEALASLARACEFLDEIVFLAKREPTEDSAKRLLKRSIDEGGVTPDTADWDWQRELPRLDPRERPDDHLKGRQLGVTWCRLRARPLVPALQARAPTS
jgi:hypothetical protein